jgi:hypothetical protein
MTDTEVEQVVLDVVRQYTQNESAAASSRFEEDLRLRERGREMLFASLASAFAARGVNLPSRGFMLSQFMSCPTPAAVRDGIREKVFGATPAARPAAAPAREAREPARPAAEAERGAKVKRKAKAPAKPAAKRKPAAIKPAAKKAASAAKPNPRRPKKR